MNGETAADVLNQALPEGQAPVTDADVEAHCEACGAWRTMAECDAVLGAESRYACHACGNTLLIISDDTKDAKYRKGRGFPIGTYLLRNVVEMRFRNVVIEKSPLALAT